MCMQTCCTLNPMLRCRYYHHTTPAHIAHLQAATTHAGESDEDSNAMGMADW